jgi:hypothetical protein
MVLTTAEHSEISKKMEIYKLVAKTFGYAMVVQDRTTRMLGKLQVQCLKISNFNVFPFYLFVTRWNIIRCLSFLFIHCRCSVDKLW